MSNVTLSIGGRSFTVACADGEEAHVAGLGRMIDAKLADMGGMANQSEARMLLFAALLLADELQDAKAGSAASPAPVGPSPYFADKLEAIASRMENLASRLEGGGSNP